MVAEPLAKVARPVHCRRHPRRCGSAFLIRRSSVFLWPLALALVIAGCGGGSARTPTETPVPEPTVAAAASATPDALASAEPDGARALGHVRRLAEEIGPRTAGTAGELAARDYIRGTLEAYGYDVSVEPFPFDATEFLPARVDIAADAAAADTIASVPAIAMRGSSAGSLSGRLLAVMGAGRAADLPAGSAGAVLLVERGDLTFSEKAANAAAAGAVALIVENNEDGSFVGKLDGAAAIPVVGVSRADGERLRQRAAAGASARVSVTPPQGTAYNVVARPRGVTACATVTGGHYDSVPVTGGADDNASGTASVLETARVLAARREQGANCFVLFSAEEFGLFGSKAFVASLGEDGVGRLRAMVNLDVVGMPEGLTLIGDDDLIETARVAAQRLGLETTRATLPRGAGSDHLSFQQAGVPVVMLYRDDPQIHTTADAVGRISERSLAETVGVAVGVLEALAPASP